MTIQHVNGKIIWSQIHGLEDFIEGHHLPVDLAHTDLPVSLQALLDEPQQVLLVHAGGGVDVGVHLPHVVEVPVWHSLLLGQLTDLVQQQMEFVLRLKKLQTLETETLERSISNHSTQELKVSHKFLQANNLNKDRKNQE